MVVLPSPMSICAHSAPCADAAARAKSRTSATCRARKMMPCAYSKTSMRGSKWRVAVALSSPTRRGVSSADAGDVSLTSSK